MHRKFWLPMPALALLALLLAPLLVYGDTVLDAGAIKAALRTTAIEEGDFVERVVAKANAGKLPVELVESTFQWARKKPRHRFQYFKRALTQRAAALGITL